MRGRSTTLGAVIGCCALGVVAACGRGESRQGGDGRPRWVVAGSDEVTGPEHLTLAAGLVSRAFVADPLVRDPVALAVDDRGRLVVVDARRDRRTPLESLRRPGLLSDDLALRTVDDLRALLERVFEDTPELLVADPVVVRVVVDDDGDGRADRSAVVAEGSRGTASGAAGGVLAMGGDVWFASAPDLWRIPAAGSCAEELSREPLHSGFGVHVGISGHDLHAPVLGPDGRLYFAMGDRGAHVTTREGTVIELADTGAVFRCEPDGAELEVHATGLRNPRGLAFDAGGNLFTVDEDPTGIADSRVIHVVRGGDYGWRGSYQHLPDCGPWTADLVRDGEIDGVLPNAGPVGRSPGGLDHHPGTGFDPRERGRFVLGDLEEGVVSFGVATRGASFAVDDVRSLLRGIRVPAVAFGPDGALWVAEARSETGGQDGARVHRVFASGALDEPLVREVARVLEAGFARRDVDDLVVLLGHPDERVRQRAHLELAARGDAGHGRLAGALTSSDSARVRLHAVWGLSVAARRHGADRGPLVQALGDTDPLVRARAARACGDLRIVEAARSLRGLLRRGSAIERMEAALALARVGGVAAVPDVVEMARDGGRQDPFLRHAAVEALRALAREDELAALAEHSEPSVRRTALLALRRDGSPTLQRFLDDPDEGLRNEAARAIYDIPIPAALPALADRVAGAALPATAKLRAIAAAARVGRLADAERLADLARSDAEPGVIRSAALRALGEWGDPGDVDAIVGRWSAIPARDDGPARRALADCVAEVVRVSDPEIVTAFVGAVRALRPRDGADALARIASDEGKVPSVRKAALAALADLGAGPPFVSVVEAALRSAAGTGESLGSLRALLEDGDPVRGRVVFDRGIEQHGCRGCHAVAGAGGDLGPALDSIGNARSPEEILAAVLSPTVEVEGGHADESMTRGELRDLIAYLRSLR